MMTFIMYFFQTSKVMIYIKIQKRRADTNVKSEQFYKKNRFVYIKSTSKLYLNIYPKNKYIKSIKKLHFHISYFIKYHKKLKQLISGILITLQTSRQPKSIQFSILRKFSHNFCKAKTPSKISLFPLTSAWKENIIYMIIS